MRTGSQISLLKYAALSTIAVGCIGSLAFMHHVGRHNHSIVLVMLFWLWVSSAFGANLWVWFSVGRDSHPAKAPYHLAISAVSLGSLGIYGFVAFGPPMSKPAFPFLIIPLVSWIIAALLTATLLARGRKNEGA